MMSSFPSNSRRAAAQAAFLLSLTAACLAGCGGGGGSGSPAPPNAATPTSPPVSPPPPPSPPVSTWIPPGVTPTAEDLQTPQLQLNNGLYAYARGDLGANEEVAVYGTGVDAHPELSGRLLQGFDAISGQVGSTVDLDPDGHDTAVSGVIAAARGNGGVEGVAPLADIVPVRIVNAEADFNATDAQLATAINWVSNQGVKISNNSWNASVSAQSVGAARFSATMPQSLAAWRNAVAGGGVEIWAAGNEGQDQVDLFAGLPLLYPELQKGWVAVGSVDSDGVLSAFSNKCGAAAAWCLVAPGGTVGLIDKNAGFAVGSGTSFSAPQVAGAEAALLAAFSNLTPQTALQILFQTANKTGIYADQSTYGQGLLDIERATRPVGTLNVAAQGGVSFQASATSMSLGSSFGMGLIRATAQLPLVAQDSFQRGFATPLAARMTPGVPNFDGASRLGAFGRPDEEVWTDGSMRLSLLQSADPRVSSPGDGNGAKFAGTTTIAGVETRLGFGIDPGRLLDSGRTPVAADLAGGMLAQGAVSNPYLALIDGAWSGAVAAPFAGGTMVFAAASGRPIQRLGFDPQASDNGSTAATVELSYRIGTTGTLRGEAGLLQEQASILGSTGTGAARVGTSRTEFAGLTGEIALSPTMAAAAGFHAGLTDTGGRTGSLIQGTEGVTSFAAGLGLVETGALTNRGKWVTGASMPLRATSGDAQLVLPTAVDTGGNAVFSRVRAGLKADGREVDLQTAWSAPMTDQAAFTGGLLWRQDPNNIRAAAAETVAAVRVDVRF